jgi:hypothetical protein
VTGAVDGHADRLEPAGVVPVGELGADEAGVGPGRLLDQRGDRARGEGDVVVAQQQVAGALDGLHHLVGGGAEAGVGVDAAHEGRRAGGRHPLGRVVLAARVDDQDREVGVVLGRERAKAVLEPRAGFVGHHDRDDGGRGRTGGRRREVGGGIVHDGRRLAVTSAGLGDRRNTIVMWHRARRVPVACKS